MRKLLYDIEIYRNFSYWAFQDYVTKEVFTFEISEVRNDLKALYDFITSYKSFLISFNGIHYDNMVTNYLINNYDQYKRLNYIDITLDLKYFSDKLINNEFEDQEVKTIKYTKNQWIDIDLYCYWSKMLRLSKKISLKSLGIQLGYPVVQELPFKPDTILKLNDLESLKYYCRVHDLGVLRMLTDAMKDDIILRSNIVKDTKIQCWSMDAVKIASESLLQDYCKITSKKNWEVRKLKFDKPHMNLNECLKGFDPQFELPIFQKLWVDVLNSSNSYSQEILVTHNNTNIRLTYGIGGLHSVNENERYYTDATTQVVTSDIASLYPNLIINYNCIRFPEVLNRYKEIKAERLIAKKNKDKAKDTFLKLILNSTSGLLDNQHSWLYYPEGAMRLRLIGQLFLTKSIEVCILNNWQVVSANTDGIEVIVPKDKLDKYQLALDDIAKKFDLDFEHEYYNKIIYKNVNNYIAETESGKLKQKGLFVYNPVLGNSCDELVIAKALEAYYINDIKPEDFITNPEQYNIHIFDYCKSNKISKDFKVMWNGKEQQQLNRYYFSRKGAYLYKVKHATNSTQHVNVGNSVILFNEYKDLPWEEYNLDFQYYIRQTRKIISELENHNQLTLF